MTTPLADVFELQELEFETAALVLATAIQQAVPRDTDGGTLIAACCWILADIIAQTDLVADAEGIALVQRYLEQAITTMRAIHPAPTRPQ